MKQSIVVKGLVFALVALPLVTGCKKKEGGATAGSGATPATGSATMAAAGSAATPAMAGSAATPAAGSDSAVAAATTGSGSAAAAGSAADPVASWAADEAPAPATSKVTGTRDGNAAPGVFDRAIYFKVTDEYGSIRHQLHLTTGCDKHSCSDYVVLRGGIYADNKFGKDCPDTTTMDIEFDGDADPVVGPVSISVGINTPTSGGEFSGTAMKGSTLTAVSDKEIKGKIDVKEGKSEAKGEFTAKNCGTIVFPKKQN